MCEELCKYSYSKYSGVTGSIAWLCYLTSVSFGTSTAVRKSRREFGSWQMTNFSLAQPRVKWLLETLRVQEVKKNSCAFRHPDSPMASFEINARLREQPGKPPWPAGWGGGRAETWRSGISKHGAVVSMLCLWRISEGVSVLGVQTVGRAGRCAQGLIWRIDTMSGVGAWGNVGETMRGLSRTYLPRLHPAPSAAAQFPRAAVHKNTSAVPFSLLTKQMIRKRRISLRSLEPTGK